MFYTSGTASFQCYYYSDQGFSLHAGFTVSNNTNMETPGFGNQYSVYAKGGAVSDSKKFAVGYYGFVQCFAGKGGRAPGTVTFLEEGQPAEHLISNSTYAFRWWTLGEGARRRERSHLEKVDAIPR